jgi:hypothetical protein
MPPIIKIYEALGAIGDEPVRLLDESHATVGSSEGDKTYDVDISTDLRTISSNDNASFWQGYLGYPAIAVMIARGLLNADGQFTKALAGMPWKELNRRFRNDYLRTLAEIETRLRHRGIDPALVQREAETILTALREYAPLRGPRRRPPRERRSS